MSTRSRPSQHTCDATKLPGSTDRSPRPPKGKQKASPAGPARKEVGEGRENMKRCTKSYTLRRSSRKICGCLLRPGWGPMHNHHSGAGQAENFTPTSGCSSDWGVRGG
eukprot:6212046-Pleurochrysis_carterae.AAC.6